MERIGGKKRKRGEEEENEEDEEEDERNVKKSDGYRIVGVVRRKVQFKHRPKNVIRK